MNRKYLNNDKSVKEYQKNGDSKHDKIPVVELAVAHGEVVEVLGAAVLVRAALCGRHKRSNACGPLAHETGACWWACVDEPDEHVCCLLVSRVPLLPWQRRGW